MEWLVRSHAITILPSVASLWVLRHFPKQSIAPKPYVGFGNPLLFGPDGVDTSARDRQRCPKDAPRVVQRVAARGATQLPGVSSLFRGSQAAVAEVQKLPALPDTAAYAADCGLA
jgi:hypothetical protein